MEDQLGYDSTAGRRMPKIRLRAVIDLRSRKKFGLMRSDNAIET